MNVSPDNLRKQNTYFMVSFFDADLLIPEITTVVYLGKDIFEEGTDNHYFQEYRIFVNGGGGVSPTSVIEASADNLDNFFELDATADLLVECEKRRQRSRSA
jgi:hypothetical protein